jgi:hypothetical protein
MPSGRSSSTGCRTAAPGERSASPRPRSHLLLGPLAALGHCQPDGSLISTLDDLRCWLSEMVRTGEAVCLDGLAARVQRPRGWTNQKVLYDAKRHTAQGLTLSTIHGDLLWMDGAGRAAATSTSSSNWQGWTRCWAVSRSPAWWTEGSAAWPRRASTGMRRLGTVAPRTGSAMGSGRSTAARRGCARWWSSRSGILPTPGRYAAGGPAVPSPGRLPRRRRAHLPRPLAAPSLPT